MQLPQIGFIRQLHEEDAVSDTQAHVTRQLTDSRLLDPVKAGDSVLLTAGSRGIVRSFFSILARTAVRMASTSWSSMPQEAPSMSYTTFDGPL